MYPDFVNIGILHKFEPSFYQKGFPAYLLQVKDTRETTARVAMDPDVWHIIGTCISAEDFWHTLL